MASNDGHLHGLALLEWHMRSIQREAPTVHINRAQCALVARRLKTILHTLRRLPDPSPSPQVMAVFVSADMLIQRMKCEGWTYLLLRHFTCSQMFTALFERMKKMWNLHSTASWAVELRAAKNRDEVENASLCVQLLSRGEGVFSYNFEIQKNNFCESVPMTNEEQMISFFRRRELSCWKVSFEELTPPDVSPCDTLVSTSARAPPVFDVLCGYRYKGASVTLHLLEAPGGRLLSPNTLAAFVQDMVSRSGWCHPNIVPFFGAFTEKMLSHDSDPFNTAVTPLLALGLITEDVTRLVARRVNRDDPSTPAGSFVLCQAEDHEAALTYRSLYDLLFVERRRFTIKEAVEITLQVADALQYILMDGAEVPEEVAAAWVTVSPSNIFLCTTSAATPPPSPVFAGAGSASQVREPTGVFQDAWVRPPAAEEARGEEDSGGRMSLPITGAFSVVYSPPVYVEEGPFSRWRPHPHAASPASYALTQLLLALVSNRPPYRKLESQKDLAARVFGAAKKVNDDDDDDDDGAPVKMSIPIGSVIPGSLSREMRQLCAHGLLLRHPRQRRASVGLTLDDFAERLRAMHDGVMDVFCHAASPLRSESPNSLEMMPLSTPLSEYGDLSSDVVRSVDGKSS